MKKSKHKKVSEISEISLVAFSDLSLPYSQLLANGRRSLSGIQWIIHTHDEQLFGEISIFNIEQYNRFLRWTNGVNEAFKTLYND